MVNDVTMQINETVSMTVNVTVIMSMKCDSDYVMTVPMITLL